MTETVIKLPPDVAAKIAERVASGSAADGAEVVRAGLASLEAEDERRMAQVRLKLAEAVADPRPSVSADDAFARAEALIDQFRKS